MSSVGGDATSVFPDVVRQLFVSDPQVKRLAHICLSRYADSNPDIVLLCVNALQRDLADINPLNRGVGIRTTVGIRNKEVSDNALSAIKKGASDSSVYVRKCAAASVAKYQTLHPEPSPEDSDELLSILDRLMSDYEPTVLSMTLMSLWHTIAHRTSEHALRAVGLVHPHFLRIVSVLPSLDWIGQFFGICVLHAYCVSNFTLGSASPHLASVLDAIHQIVRFSSHASTVQIGITVLQLLAPSAPIPNVEIILAKHMHALPMEMVDQFLPSVSLKRVKPFLVNLACDSADVKIKKVKLMGLCVTGRNAMFIVAEMVEYLRATEEEGSDNGFARDCVDVVTHVGSTFPEYHSTCLQCLIGLISSAIPTVSNEAVNAVRFLMDLAQGALSVDTVKKTGVLLCSIVGSIVTAQARASAIWLIRQCHDAVPVVVPNALRAASKNLRNEDALVKIELCVLASHALTYHEANAKGERDSTVPSKVSNMLVEPLRELVEYIFAVSAADRSIGHLVKALSDPTIQAECFRFAHSVRRKVESLVPEQVSGYRSMKALRRDLARAVEDSRDSLRDGKPRTEHHEHKSMSSENTNCNRMPYDLSVSHCAP